MPVIFSTPTSHRVFMLDKDADFMLKAMQTSGNIPGALYSEAASDALEALKSRIELDSEEDSEKNPDGGDNKDYIGINTKALPLIELMQRAIDQNEKLIWDKG